MLGDSGNLESQYHGKDIHDAGQQNECQQSHDYRCILRLEDELAGGGL